LVRYPVIARRGLADILFVAADSAVTITGISARLSCRTQGSASATTIDSDLCAVGDAVMAGRDGARAVRIADAALAVTRAVASAAV
jgi:hypothetical protein